MSDDPLANCIFMILDDSSAPEYGDGCRYVCACRAHAGFLYLGITGETVS